MQWGVIRLEKIRNIKRILVGVDASDDAQLAFRVAIHRARELGADLYIVNVIEDHDINVYEKLDDDFMRRKRSMHGETLTKYKQLAEEAGVKNVKIISVEGNPGKTIVKDVIPSVKPDLLIVGSIGKQGVRKYFGSQAAYMAKYSPVSVLVVR